LSWSRKSSRRTTPQKGGGGLILIGAYKLLECLLLIAAGIGAIRLLHRDLQAVLLHWVHVLRVDPDNHYIHGILARALSVSPKQLKELSAGTFIYAALRFLEGIGLILRKKWGEYLTIVATAVFIPLEIYEIFRHLTWLRLVIFVLNVATLWYLIWTLQRNRVKSRSV
jgi:uncharacterized membrane protein (DUF2068 family)